MYRTTVLVTRGRRVVPGQCRLDRQLEGQTMDLVCDVEGVSLGILLQRPDRRVHLDAGRFRGKRVGVLEIDLLETLSLFRTLNRQDKIEGFHRALARFLFERPTHKRWLYHPRQEVLVQAATEKLKQRIAQEERATGEQRGAHRREQEETPSVRAPAAWHRTDRVMGTRPEDQEETPDELPVFPATPRLERNRNPGGPVRYECVLCDYSWTGSRLGLNPCPKCGSHLFRRVLKGETGPGT